MSAYDPIIERQEAVHEHLILGLTLSLATLAPLGPASAQGFPPPADRFEQPPPPPGPPGRSAWEPGHWRWDGYRYVWADGHYIERRSGYARYEPGHWVRRGGGWFWDPPHWR